jgi:hypothetical protein
VVEALSCEVHSVILKYHTQNKGPGGRGWGTDALLASRMAVSPVLTDATGSPEPDRGTALCAPTWHMSRRPPAPHRQKRGVVVYCVGPLRTPEDGSSHARTHNIQGGRENSTSRSRLNGTNAEGGES